ncbi:unnamed protein product [Notodromas monacha]|uniref:MICOS complex subunit n=1 Tax=Notodromas monacha TaxID=399045 RepID=A0A7R9GG02_9CRUS|nr:unnamed protein product [Notodromas monacha]CAG0921198.1 unnamed protein product [Notodromas monacha]
MSVVINRPLVTAFNKKNEKVSSLKPFFWHQFNQILCLSGIRHEIAMNNQQPYSVSEDAGAIKRLPSPVELIVKLCVVLVFEVAVPSIPAKTLRRWHGKVNVSQKRYVPCSALAASDVPSLVFAGGHASRHLSEILFCRHPLYLRTRCASKLAAVIKMRNRWIPNFVYVVPPPTKFESAIKDARLAVGPYTGTVADLAGEAVSQGTYAISSLQRPENELIRYATIGLGAMCGSLLAYRKSFIKKLTLPIFGALGMTALSYPDKFSAVKDIAKEELAEASAVGLIFAKSVYVDLVDRMFNSPSLLGSADSKNDDGVKEINRIGEQMSTSTWSEWRKLREESLEKIRLFVNVCEQVSALQNELRNSEERAGFEKSVIEDVLVKAWGNYATSLSSIEADIQGYESLCLRMEASMNCDNDRILARFYRVGLSRRLLAVQRAKSVLFDNIKPLSACEFMAAVFGDIGGRISCDRVNEIVFFASQSLA